MRKMIALALGGVLLAGGAAGAADVGGGGHGGVRPATAHHGGSGRHDGKRHADGCAGAHRGACPRAAK